MHGLFLTIRSLLCVALVLVSGNQLAYAQATDDKIGEAFAREFTFLKAQKEELEDRLSSDTASRAGTERRARDEVDALQAQFVAISNDVLQQELAVAELQQELDAATSSSDVIVGVMQQIATTLAPFDIDTGLEAVGADGGSVASSEQSVALLQAAFENSAELLTALTSLQINEGEFYLQDGKKVEGTLYTLGNIASYGASDEGSGVLLPAGSGLFQLWSAANATDVPGQFDGGRIASSLPMYIYENPETAVTPPEQKSIRDTEIGRAHV